MWQVHDEENSNGHAKWSKNRMHAAIPSEFGQFALEAVLSSPFCDSFEHFVCSYSRKCFPEILTKSSRIRTYVCNKKTNGHQKRRILHHLEVEMAPILILFVVLGFRFFQGFPQAEKKKKVPKTLKMSLFYFRYFPQTPNVCENQKLVAKC